jgi:hypothetical protein
MKLMKLRPVIGLVLGVSELLRETEPQANSKVIIFILI